MSPCLPREYPGGGEDGRGQYGEAETITLRGFWSQTTEGNKGEVGYEI